jgi:hypothetical protein
MSENDLAYLAARLDRIEKLVEEVLARIPDVEPWQRDDTHLEELRKKYGPGWPRERP